MTAEMAPQPPRFKVYHGPSGDFLRTPAGQIRFFTNAAEARAVAQQHGGFVLPADAPSPGGFDRTWA
ncbi:MAG TPA: hypothetical protein VFD32_02815 [Dehalococcoidia bacterium]|nr:hypothetical protein [Dehalococcoidia bacterium]